MIILEFTCHEILHIISYTARRQSKVWTMFVRGTYAILHGLFINLTVFVFGWRTTQVPSGNDGVRIEGKRKTKNTYQTFRIRTADIALPVHLRTVLTAVLHGSLPGVKPKLAVKTPFVTL